MSLIKLRRVLSVLNDEKGANALEFALILPVLMLIIMGIIQFGFIFYNYITIVHAAREGARWASLENSVSDVTAKAQSAAPGLIFASTPTVDVSVEQRGQLGSGDTITNTDVGKYVTVTVSCSSQVFLLNMEDVALGSAATQRIE